MTGGEPEKKKERSVQRSLRHSAAFRQFMVVGAGQREEGRDGFAHPATAQLASGSSLALGYKKCRQLVQRLTRALFLGVSQWTGFARAWIWNQRLQFCPPHHIKRFVTVFLAVDRKDYEAWSESQTDPKPCPTPCLTPYSRACQLSCPPLS